MAQPWEVEGDRRDLQRFFAISQDLLCVLDHEGRFRSLSRSWSEVLGHRLEDLVGRPFSELLHPEDLEWTLTLFERRIAGRWNRGPVENRYRHLDGSYRWLRWESGTAEEGDLVYAVARDITDLHRREEQQRVVADLGRLALTSSRLDALFEAAVTGLAGVVEDAQVSVAEVVDGGRRVRLRATSRGHDSGGAWELELADMAGSAVEQCLRTGRPAVLRYAELAPGVLDDTVRDWGMRSTACVPIGGEAAPWAVLALSHADERDYSATELALLEQTAHVLGLARERASSEDRLRHQADHDALTGLPNRELLAASIEQALERARAGEGVVGLLLCDLDGFKDVNDALGHDSGDTVLVQLAERLTDLLAGTAVVARLGGDEFAICVTGAATSIEVLGIADAVVDAMHLPFRLPELEIPLSTSIGVVIAPAHGQDATTLLRHADVAMYRAKARRCGWALYDARVDAPGSDRLALTRDLRHALADGGLTVSYQPIAHLATGELLSVEALCRWEHPLRGEVSPAEFIPLAERTGLIGALTAWVVEQAAHDVLTWRGQGLHLRCAVNLSLAAVDDARASLELVDRMIELSDVLTVEITESWLVDARGRAVVDELSAGGITIAIDDFGTGYSSLAYLRAFPADVLKIDQAFVRDVAHSPRDADIVRAVADLAQALDLDVVVEGVETPQAAATLLACGLHVGQGLVFSAPLPADELLAWSRCRLAATGATGPVR